MQFSWTLKCKYKDYTALFSKSLSVHCTVFWFPPHTSLHLKMGYFPCSEGVPFFGMGCRTLSCFTCVYPPCHRPTSGMVGGLPMEGTNFHCKTRTLCCLFPTAQGHVHACQTFSRTLAITHKTQWIQWELSLCTACDVGTSPWALM